VNLGETYGSVRVAFDAREMQKAIKDHLVKIFKDAEVNVARSAPGAGRSGEHLRPDGTVGLGCTAASTLRA
jgi:hypothetical protein